jgi:protein-glutamine gamma-glutamyltransferase
VKQHYTLQTDLPFLESQDDLVDAFFFKYHGGYPDHFATALTILLRSIGLSTRLVTGFGPGQFNPFTGYYVVKNTDAYAMTEVYFHKYGWFSFDAIPGHPLTPPSVAESQTFTALKAFWQWIAGWLPSPVTGWLNWAVGGLLTILGEAIGRFLGLFRQGAWGWLLGIAAAIGGSFLLWLSWAGYQRWRYWRRLRRLEPTARLYQQLTDWLARQGLPKHPAQTPWEYARIVANRGFLRGDVTPQIITNAYLAWRYGGQTPDLVELQQSFRQLQARQQRQWFQQLPQLTARRVRLRYRRWRR